MHTNDAPGALTRLVDMGVEPYLVASSLEAVLAQRLVRVLCKHCKQEDHSPAAQAFKAQVGIPANTTIYRSVGCRECRQTGFHDRHAIFEWMDTNNEIRELILKNASSDVIRDAARRSGMSTLGRRWLAAGAAGHYHGRRSLERDHRQRSRGDDEASRGGRASQRTVSSRGGVEPRR